jgi:NAD(P)-dependent dehydrogenase (short-subunit alcohol dehydrogenase family)
MPVVIAGASSGIRRATALEFVRQGVRVCTAPQQARVVGGSVTGDAAL